mmetsp:Transcript_28270/g.50181  ORF Transcript_28270/g.50181 Transcript_28270/m.50181 type:complete len:494 (+) Transcript_28270:1-1482(+)
MAAKKKEILALTASIEDKTERLGEAKVLIVQLKQDLSDTQKALADDQAFLAGLDKNCADKKAEHDANMKVRAEELVAIADTIKVLNDDDALELFKKTLPGASSASFVQMQARSGVTALQRQRALQLIQSLHSKDTASRVGIDFIVMAMRGKKVSFEKVLKMIDDMVALLGKEQTDDDDKKATCELTFDKLEDKIKELGAGVSSLEVSIAQEEDLIATLTEEIKALAKSIADLDASVADATAQRKAEHAAFEELMSSDQAAKELLAFAKNRLNKFYNPSVYIAPPTTTLSMEDKLYVEGGGVLPTTPPPGGIAGTGVEVAASFVQISAHSFGKVAPPPPPETMAAYSKKSSESTGVIAMIDMLIKDLSTEMTEAEVTEKNSQAEYVAMMADSKEKRAGDVAAMTNKQAAKAELESDLQALSVDLSSKQKEFAGVVKVTAALHADCDFSIKYYDVRKTARTEEMDSLSKAKAVLSGADYSLVQQASRKRKFLSRA